MSKKKLVRPIQFGNVALSSNIFYAPLAGCSDYPFRKMSRLYDPGLIFCEMVKMEALVRNDIGTLRLLDYSPDMHPIGGQLCGAKPAIAGAAAKIIEDLGFDTVDLNCGCPVDKITKDGSGSGLLKNPEIIGEIISNMVAAVSIPVTVKIRAGWDEASIVAAQITEIAEEAGAKAITIHGRTRQQGYKGPANWDWISLARAASKNIFIIGNGDIFHPEDALRMMRETGCDGVLVARGSLGQPWIERDIAALDAREPLRAHTIADKRAALVQHFTFIRDYLPDRKVVIDMRRVGCWYFTKSKGTRAFREAISKASSVNEIEELIHTFPFEEGEEAGQGDQGMNASCGC